MKRLFRAMRYSSVGVVLAGIFAAIAGCSNEDQIRALILFLILLLTGGGGQDAETPDVASEVAYSCVNNNFTGLCGIRFDGTNATVLELITNPANQVFSPAINNRGQIVYTCLEGTFEGSICGVNFNGTGAITLDQAPDANNENFTPDIG